MRGETDLCPTLHELRALESQDVTEGPREMKWNDRREENMHLGVHARIAE